MIEKNPIRSTLCFSKKQILVYIICIVAITTVIGISKISEQKNKIGYKAKASEQKDLGLFSSSMRNGPSDMIADIILGKKRFEEVIPKEIVPYKVSGPAGVFVDKNNRLYLFDGMNSRVLGYKSIGVCVGSSFTNQCSTDSDCEGGRQCQISIGKKNGRLPDIVIGQPSYTDYAACNMDGSYMNYPKKAPASASTLCTMREDEPSYFEGGSAAGMDADQNGNLYLPDPFNHRILKYTDPFSSDIVADEVWGQDNFTMNECNKGISDKPIDNSSLCFVHATYAKPAVDIDKYGNLWVADIGNNRVLRFLYNPQTKQIAKKADIVLGQSDFSSRSSGTQINKFNAPNMVTSDSSGNIYVSDFWNKRILLFSFPQKNGMDGVILLDKLAFPHAVQLLEDKKKILVSVEKHINSYNYNFIKANQPSITLSKQYPSNDSFGSIGVFSDGSFIFSNSDSWQSVSYYDKTEQLTSLFDDPEAEKNGYDAHNFISNKGFHSLRGITITDKQIIVADAHRLSFWNKTEINQVQNGEAIDGYFGNDEGKLFSAKSYYRIAKGTKYLWALTIDINNPSLNTIQKYSLPVYQDQKPEETIFLNQLNMLGKSKFPDSKIMAPSDIYVDEENAYMWVALPWNDRVIRIRIPGKSYSSYTIDAVIGGKDIPDRTPGWELKCDEHKNYPKSLCYPGNLNEDKWGNLYISDMMVENAGSRRFLIYKYEELQPDSNLLVLMADDAYKVFPQAESWKPAFNSQNVMVVGHYPFAASTNRFPSVFNNILTKTEFTPDSKIRDYYAQAFTMEFDAKDNLYIAELNRGSLYIYKKPFNYHNPVKPYKLPLKEVENEESCKSNGLSYYKACKKCGTSNLLLSEVCPNYCSQFNDNFEGCVASQKRGYGCSWYGGCSMCMSNKDANTYQPDPCPIKPAQNILFEGTIVSSYLQGARPDSLMVDLEEKENQSIPISNNIWNKVVSIKVAENPEKDIPYRFVIPDSIGSKVIKLEANKTYRIRPYELYDTSIALPYTVSVVFCSGEWTGGDRCIFSGKGTANFKIVVDGCATLGCPTLVPLPTAYPCYIHNYDLNACNKADCSYYSCSNRCLPGNLNISLEDGCSSLAPTLTPAPSPK